MGFSGGGSNVLLPHTHDGTVSQDGGPLNFNNVTQSQSAAGEIFYSDGVHLQQLAYPVAPAGEALTAPAASTAPSWVAAGGGAAYQKVAETELLVAGTSIDVPFSQVDMVDISELVVFANLTTGATGRSANMRVNSNTSSNYSLTGWTVGTGPSIAATTNSGTSWHLELSGSASAQQQMVAHLIVNGTGDIQGIIQYAADNYPSSYTVKLNTSTTFFDNIEIISDPSGGGNFAVGSNVTVFKILR